MDNLGEKIKLASMKDNNSTSEVEWILEDCPVCRKKNSTSPSDDENKPSKNSKFKTKSKEKPRKRLIPYKRNTLCIQLTLIFSFFKFKAFTFRCCLIHYLKNNVFFSENGLY